MNIADLDTLQQRIQRVGQASGLPKNMTQEQLIDELQRQLGAIGDVLRAVLQTLRASPRYEKDASLFLVDCRAGGNILSTAQASVEGFSTTAGLAIYRHGLGYNLDRMLVVYSAYTPNVGTLNGQAQRGGTVTLYKYDQNRSVFQVDQDAITNTAVFVVSCYPSLPVPSLKVNPGAQQKTGAATPQLGIVTAINAAGLP